MGYRRRNYINLFDDADTWQLASGQLYVASVSSSASLTGGYTISHKTAPASFILSSDATGGSFTEAVGNSSFAEFIIEGTTTQSLFFGGSNLLGASASIRVAFKPFDNVSRATPLLTGLPLLWGEELTNQTSTMLTLYV